MNPVVPSPLLARAMSIDGTKGGGWTDRFFKKNKIRPSASIDDIPGGYESDTCDYESSSNPRGSLVRSQSHMGHEGARLKDVSGSTEEEPLRGSAKAKAHFRSNRSNSLLISAIERSASFVSARKAGQKQTIRSGIHRAIEAMATGNSGNNKDCDGGVEGSSGVSSRASSPRFGKVGAMTSAAVSRMRTRKKSYRLSVPVGQEFGSNPDFLDLFPEVRREVLMKETLTPHAKAQFANEKKKKNNVADAVSCCNPRVISVCKTSEFLKIKCLKSSFRKISMMVVIMTFTMILKMNLKGFH
jgi:hypothetical protein